MPVSPPAAGQVFSELRRSQLTPTCDLAPGGCPASCPDAHRPTHGHRHVRNRAVRHISDLNSLSSKNRRREKNAGRSEQGWRSRWAWSATSSCCSALPGERLDALRGADEGDHDGDAAGEEQALHDVLAVGPEIEQVGERPAAREGG